MNCNFNKICEQLNIGKRRKDNIMNKAIINNFLKISKIYRESGNEKEIADFFEQIAKDNNLYCYRDKNNNILIRKNGKQGVNPILLQAHLDMVCVSENDYDFCKGIDVLIDGNVIKANGTSLGADQGIGLAYMLTLIEDSNETYPTMEFLFTTEEETTFNGAENFDYSKLQSERMINLDNAKEDTIYIGSDADICNEYSKNLEYIKTNMQGYKISLKTEFGGNSGENIEYSKDNAIITLIRLLKDKDFLIKSINGGINENDIATFCEIELNTNMDLCAEYSNVENIYIEKINNSYCLNKQNSNRIIDNILKFASGNLTKSISANLGKIETTSDSLNILYIARCLNKEVLEKYIESFNKDIEGFDVKRIYNDSALQPNSNSYLLDLYKTIYYKRNKQNPKEKICHGGNECACISKYSGIKDIISIGPNIDNFHTTKEVTYVDSILRVYELLQETLIEMKG